jgi:sec-independent protein translocase protein TatC
VQEKNLQDHIKDIKTPIIRSIIILFCVFGICFYLSLLILLPYFVLEVFLYVRPALKFGNTRKTIVLFIIGTVLYFLSGFLILKFVLPLFLALFVSFGFLGVNFLIDGSLFINFVIKMFFAFGILFEVPIILIMLVDNGIVKKSFLKKHRKFIFILAFIIGAVITPPDVFSQIFTALFLYASFECVLFFTKERLG